MAGTLTNIHGSTSQRAKYALAFLKKRGSKRGVDGMARYGIVARKAFGVSVADIRALAKRLGRDPKLAAILWTTGYLEARMLSSFVNDPAAVTSAEMDRHVRDFDNWAICDTVCFHLWDKSPLAWRKIRQWSMHRDEFVKRAAYALIASIALHDKKAPNALFVKSLRLVELGAYDDRNFVKKAVSWALRGVAKRDPKLKRAALVLARRLAHTENRGARWVGKDVLRQLM